MLPLILLLLLVFLRNNEFIIKIDYLKLLRSAGRRIFVLESLKRLSLAICGTTISYI